MPPITQWVKECGAGQYYQEEGNKKDRVRTWDDMANPCFVLARTLATVPLQVKEGLELDTLLHHRNSRNGFWDDAG